MALRLVEIHGVSDKKRDIERILEKITICGLWQEELDQKIVTRILVDSEQIEPLLDIFEKKCKQLVK